MRAVAALLGLAACAPVASAQLTMPPPEEARSSLGVAAGSLAGLSARLPARARTSTVVVAGWDGENFLSAQLRLQRTEPLPGSPLHGIASVGVFVGSRRETPQEVLTAGPNASVGLGFYRGRFEVALEVLPGVRVIPTPKAFYDTAFTLRYALF